MTSDARDLQSISGKYLSVIESDGIETSILFFDRFEEHSNSIDRTAVTIFETTICSIDVSIGEFEPLLVKNVNTAIDSDMKLRITFELEAGSISYICSGICVASRNISI